MTEDPAVAGDDAPITRLELHAAGLGQHYERLTLAPTTGEWVAAGALLRDSVAGLLGDTAVDVQQIGSSSVVGLLAKPIVDLAVGVRPDYSFAAIRVLLESDEWIYGGDAGDSGGQVFLLEVGSRRRVAHLHVVEHDGDQWRRYLLLRDLLRRSPEACAEYAAEKRRLLALVGHDREAYTEGTTGIVTALLARARQPHRE